MRLSRMSDTSRPRVDAGNYAGSLSRSSDLMPYNSIEPQSLICGNVLMMVFDYTSCYRLIRLATHLQGIK